MKKTICQLMIFMLGLCLVVSQGREFLSLIKKGERSKEMELKLEELKAKNQSLKERLEYVKSEEFVEKETREQLNMAREDEVVVILPEKLELRGHSLEANEEELPNWQRWLKLFF